MRVIQSAVAGLQTDSQLQEYLLGREVAWHIPAAGEGCSSRQPYPRMGALLGPPLPWKCQLPACPLQEVHCIILHWRSSPPDTFEQGGLPSEHSATWSQQVSASAGSTMTLSQNFSLCQGCCLVHIRGCVHQQGSWPSL